MVVLSVAVELAGGGGPGVDRHAANGADGSYVASFARLPAALGGCGTCGRRARFGEWLIGVAARVRRRHYFGGFFPWPRVGR